MNDQDLDARLTSAGEEFRRGPAEAPDLDAMLDAALQPRHRHRTWLAAAASVVVIAGAIVGVQMARQSGDPAPTAHPTKPPATIQRDGKTLSYAGDESWQNPVLDESDPKSVYINADVGGGTASWGYYCGPTTAIARVTAQTDKAVTVTVAKYATRPPASDQLVCPDIGYGPARLKVTFPQPLGDRSLVDGHRKVAQKVLDPSTVLKPGYLPNGYSGGTASWSTEHADASQRYYQGPGGTLIITSGPAELNKPLATIVEHATVRGHAATVSHVASGFAEDMLVAWNEDSTHAVTVYQMSSYQKSRPALTAAELIRVANSLR